MTYPTNIPPMHAGSFLTPDQLGTIMMAVSRDLKLPIPTEKVPALDSRLLDAMHQVISTYQAFSARSGKLGRPKLDLRLVPRARTDGGNDRMLYLHGDGAPITTKCRESERPKAELFMELRRQAQTAASIGFTIPTAVPCATVLQWFLDGEEIESDPGEDGRLPPTTRFERNAIVHLAAHFGDKRLGQITRSSCAAYRKMRKAMPGRSKLADGSRQSIAYETIRMELALLRRIVNSYRDEVLGWAPYVPVPKARSPKASWLRVSEFVRLLLSARGWIWGEDGWLTHTVWDPQGRSYRVDEKGRLRVEVTSGGAYVERPVVDRKAAARLRPILRLLLLAFYTGSRHTVLHLLRWKRNGVDGWVDVEGRVLNRIDSNKPKTAKASPPVVIPRRLARHLRLWRKRDLADGHVRVLRRKDGRPYGSLPTSEVHEAVKRAGMEFMPITDDDQRFAHPKDGGRLHVSLHVIRHTCATLLLAAGCPPQYVADLLGVSTDTLRRRYGHRCTSATVIAADALDRALSRGQRDSEALADFYK